MACSRDVIRGKETDPVECLKAVVGKHKPMSSGVSPFIQLENTENSSDGDSNHSHRTSGSHGNSGARH